MQAFFDSSTPVLNGQDSPSTTVPFEIPTIKPLGDSPVLSHYGRLNAIMTCPEHVYVDLSNPMFILNGQEHHCDDTTQLHHTLLGYAGYWDIGMVVHEVQPRPVQQQQANALGSDGLVHATKERQGETLITCGYIPIRHFTANDVECKACLSTQANAPVPIGQDSPSVKAPVVPPESPSNQAARAEFEADPEKWVAEALDDRDPLFFMGGEYPFSFDKDEPISIDDWTVKNLRDFSQGTGLTQDQIPKLLQFIIDTGHAVETRSYLVVAPTWEIIDQFVAQEAEAVNFAGQYPVMDFPALPVDGIKGQQEAVLLPENCPKCGVEVPFFSDGGYINQCSTCGHYPLAESAKAPAVTPELLTQDEIEQIYRLISHELPRAEYDRLIDKVVDLNNYAKGVR